MSQRADDDERDHPKDLADAADALKLALSSKGKDAWTWLRLAVFFGSLVANAGFWIYTKHLEDKVRIADFTDRSWTVYESFDESLRKLEAAEQKDIEELTQETERVLGIGPSKSEVEVFESWRKVDAEWIGAIVAMETEPGPEFDGTATTQAGRWRLHVPKVCIEEVREMEFGKAFPKRSIR